MHIPIGKIMTPADWLETVVVVRPASDDVRARRCPDDDDDDGDREVNKLRASARLRASPNEQQHPKGRRRRRYSGSIEFYELTMAHGVVRPRVSEHRSIEGRHPLHPRKGYFWSPAVSGAAVKWGLSRPSLHISHHTSNRPGWINLIPPT